MAEIEEVSDDDWLKVTPEIVAEALHVAAGGDKRKLCSQSLHDGGIWAKVAAVLFKNKRSSKRDRMFLYTIWSDKRKNVEVDYKALAGKGCRATRPKPPEVTDNQRCYCEKYKQRLPGEKRILCTSCQRKIHLVCAKVDMVPNVNAFVCGFCIGNLTVPPILNETIISESEGKDESKDVDAEQKSEPLYAERKTPNFEDFSSSDDELPEDSDSDHEYNGRTRIVNEPSYKELDQRNIYEPILSQEESLEPGFGNKFVNRGETTDQSIPDCGGTASYFEEISDDDLPDTPKVVNNPSRSEKNDIQVVPELPKCRTPVVPKDDQPRKRKLIFFNKRGDDVSHTTVKKEIPSPTRDELSSSSREDDDLPDSPKVVNNPSLSAKNDIQVVPELPKCRTPFVPKDDQPRKRKLMFLKKRVEDVSHTTEKKAIPSSTRDELPSSSREDDDFLPNVKKPPCKKTAASDAQGEKLDTSKVPSNFDMTITYEDWKKIVGIKPNTSGRSKKDFYLQPGYYNEIRRHFMAVNKFCVPTFTHNRLNDPESLSGNFLWIRTYCKNEKCQVIWVFTVDKKPKENRNVKINASASGKPTHYSDCPTTVKWTGNKQKIEKEKLESIMPAAEHNQIFRNADTEALHAGNFSEVPTLKALQRMREKRLAVHDLDLDVARDLAMAMKEMVEIFPDDDLPGYLQTFTVIPNRVILFTRRQMRILHTMNRQQHDAYLMIDATGGLVDKLSEPWDTSVPLLYTVILRSTKNNIHMPLTEMITSNNTSLSVKQWLEEFFVTYQKHFSVKQPFYGITKIEMDFSKAIMSATVQLFTGDVMEDYLTNFWNLMVGNTYQESKLFPIHICRFHVVRAISEKLKTEFCRHGRNLKKEYKVLQTWLRQFVRARNIKSYQRYLMDIGMICGNKFATEAVFRHIVTLQDDTPMQGPELWRKITPDKCNPSFWRRSPFGPLCEFIFQRCEAKNQEICVASTGEELPNSFYSPDFLQYIKVYIAPYFPIISHAVFECCGITLKDDTTNAIENYHGLLKLNFYKRCRNQKISRFLRRQGEFIHGFCKIAEVKLGIKEVVKTKDTVTIEEDVDIKFTDPGPNRYDGEPDWEAAEYDNKPKKNSQSQKTTLPKPEDISPDKEKEIFIKTLKRPKTPSKLDAFMGIIPLVPAGRNFISEGKVLKMTNTCSIDATLQVLVGLYVHHVPFAEYLSENRDKDPIADAVERVMISFLNSDYDEGKSIWISEVLKQTPSDCDMRGTETEQGFGALLSWMKITRYWMCSNMSCKAFVDISQTIDPESPFVFQENGNVFCVSHNDPLKTLKDLNEITTVAYHCKVCNIRGKQKHVITSTPSFIFYLIHNQSTARYKESMLPLTQVIKGKKYRVFAYTSLRGEILNENDESDDSKLPLLHFVAVFIHESKRITYDGLTKRPFVSKQLSSDGGVTSVWLVPE